MKRLQTMNMVGICRAIIRDIAFKFSQWGIVFDDLR